MNIEEWPVGATHKINRVFTKWVGEIEYSFVDGGWDRDVMCWELSDYIQRPRVEIIERPADAPYVPKVGGGAIIE